MSDEKIRTHTQSLPQEFEGLGPVQTYFIDINDVAADLPPKPEVTRIGQLRETWGVVIRSLPYLIGIKKPRFAI